jgi:hypothetical protein
LLGTISIWAPLFYQYLVGGVLFALSLVVALRSRACDLRRRADRFWLTVVLVGMGAYLGVHLLVYLLAVYAVPQSPGGAGG